MIIVLSLDMELSVNCTRNAELEKTGRKEGGGINTVLISVFIQRAAYTSIPSIHPGYHSKPRQMSKSLKITLFIKDIIQLLLMSH